MGIGALIELRHKIMHKLINNGWHLLNIPQCDVDDIFEWCEDNMGLLPELNALSYDNLPQRWYMSTVRTTPSNHWFVLFKDTEDIMWFRMHWPAASIELDV